MKNSQIIKHFNILIEEAIINAPDDDILKEIGDNLSPFFTTHLKKIKRLNTKAKAEIQRQKMNTAKELFKKIKKGLPDGDYLNQLLELPKYRELQGVLYSKFEKNTEEDSLTMMMDAKLLELLEELNKDIENEENS
jgi:hypothetical protein